MINKDGGGGDNFSILWGDTAVMRGDIELMGVPPLGKTLILPWLMPLLPYKQSDCQFQVQRKREMNGRGRHLEQKIWFLTINQVQRTLFL